MLWCAVHAGLCEECKRLWLVQVRLPIINSDKRTNEVCAKVVVAEMLKEGAEDRQQNHVDIVERGGAAHDRPLHMAEPLFYQVFHNLHKHTSTSSL